ncbi:MAG: FprA family A-type flavoprotein, partial [Prevotellaceae bacterium]|nr:FprA family A-type flavoprotein [Prevotellaceae bacterium]
LCHELSLIAPKNKILGLFGSFSWSGGGVKTLKLFADKIGWEQPAEAIEINGIPNNYKLECCDKFTDTLAPLLK